MKLVAHMDHSNPQTFEVSDLEKLIKQVQSSLHTFWDQIHVCVASLFNIYQSSTNINIFD